MSNQGHPVPTAPTAFLPAERAAEPDLLRQAELVRRSVMMKTLLDASVGFALVLNQHRQIVFVNQAFEQYLAQHGGGLRLGLRPGEQLHCVNSAATEGGCGTTEACRYCGAGQALAAAGRGLVGVRECRVRTEDAGDDLDLLVRTTPVELEGEAFVIFSAMDISAEKRRLALERIFFHDVTNTAGGIKGLSGMMAHAPPEVAVKRYAPMVEAASASLLDEIASHRDLVAAEQGSLPVHPTRFSTQSLLADLANLCAHHLVGAGRTVGLAAESEDVAIVSDRALLSRVLVNLVKNALEAEPRGGHVSISSVTSLGSLGSTASVDSANPVSRTPQEGVVRFEVHNATVIPREVQLQLFQRSFSTKGEGRGLGTYSIRLLTERYLGGTVGFVSALEHGTRFVVELPLVLSPSNA